MKQFRIIAGILFLILYSASCALADPIHEAVKSGDVNAIKSLLDKDRKLLYVKDDVGKTPLHWAVGKGQIEALNLLLDTYKADPDIRNNNGGTPLHVAASQAQPEAARILLEHGAQVNARTQNDSTPLHFAAFKGRKPGHIEAARVLIEYGADINAMIDTGATPLSLAMFRQNTQMMALLRQHGAKPGSARPGMTQGTARGKGNYYINE